MLSPSPNLLFNKNRLVEQKMFNTEKTEFFDKLVLFAEKLDERIIQAYLYFNIGKIFPECTEMIAFESSLFQKYTQFGKCDFIFETTDKKWFVVDKKYFNKNKQTNKIKEKKVIEQVKRIKESLLFINKDKNPEDIKCGIFSNNPNLKLPIEDEEITIKHVNQSDIKIWVNNYRSSLISKLQTIKI